MNYRIGKFLDASTGELDATDLDILLSQEDLDTDERSPDLPRIVPHRFGWWINVQHNDAEQLRHDTIRIADSGFSPQFLALFTTAAANECDWINLDRDA